MRGVAILVVGAVACLFWWLSTRRVKRLHVYTDQFARAFCEAYDHVLPTVEVAETLRYTRTESGRIEVLPADQQPEPIKALLEKGVDSFIMDRLRDMFRLRNEAQSLLTTFNLVEKKFNSALNRCYDLTNLFFSFVDDPSKLRTQDDLDNFSFYLNKQAFLRSTTLASIISEECKQEISG